MCSTCGCGLTRDDDHRGVISEEAHGSGNFVHLEVMRHLLEENQNQALHNRNHFCRNGVLALNLMSSPGSGKTTLLEATIEAIGHDLRIGVVVGDLETERDAQRIRARGVPAVQISTGQGCHLDAAMVHRAIEELDLSALDILFVENVGNLVCPASFDLGQCRNVTLLSVTEGDDKPAKYPIMFRAADLVVLSKSDLLPYLDDFDPGAAQAAVRALANDSPVLTLSARRGDGMENWLHWVQSELGRFRARHTPPQLPAA